jgi:hypothetical protein
LTSETTRLIAPFGLGVSGFKPCRNDAYNPGNCPNGASTGGDAPPPCEDQDMARKIEIAFTFSFVFQYIRATIYRKARTKIKIENQL